MTAKKRKTARPTHDDVPFTSKLPDGRTLFVLIPARLCRSDSRGQPLLTAAAARFVDRIQALALKAPYPPTPGYIRSLREALGLTQSQLASLLNVNKMTVARWEWGKLKPRPAAAAALEALRKQAGKRGAILAA